MINTYDPFSSHHRFRLFRSQLGLPANFYDCTQIPEFTQAILSRTIPYIAFPSIHYNPASLLYTHEGHQHLASAGCRLAVQWGTRGLHLYRRLHSAGLRPASDLACPLPAHLPFSWRSPMAVLLPLSTQFSFYPPTPSSISHSLCPLTHPSPPIPPLPPSRGPIHTRTHLRPPGPFRGGDQALLDRGIHQRHLIP